MLFTILVWALNRDAIATGPKVIAAGRLPDGPEPASSSAAMFQKIDWMILRQLDWKTGRASPQLSPLDGRNVAVPGYIVPLEDDAGTTSEFLLVPYAGACVHTPPPPPNQMIYVRMDGARKILAPFDAVWVRGVLRFSQRQSPYGKVAHEMTASQVELY